MSGGCDVMVVIVVMVVVVMVVFGDCGCGDSGGGDCSSGDLGGSDGGDSEGEQVECAVIQLQADLAMKALALCCCTMQQQWTRQSHPPRSLSLLDQAAEMALEPRGGLNLPG